MTTHDDYKKAYKELERFCYSVSHDLKTPLRAIAAYNDIIIEDNLEDLSDDSREAVYSIRSICNLTLNMIESLLMHSKANFQKLHLVRLSTTDFITDLCKEHFHITDIRRLQSNENVDFSFENKTDRTQKPHTVLSICELPDIYVDKTLFRQVFENIISNSIKFSSGRKNSELFIGYMENTNYYVFYFKDNGIGFDMSHSEKLFQVFERLHSAEEFEGSGIGLATVKNIINKHGGDVAIFSKPDRGCVVCFTIPKLSTLN